MTHVFVHGNPETDAIWMPLLDELTARSIGDFVLLSPPGFGSPAPDGWGATMSEYARWLRAELEQIDGPIDLVAHDWGVPHVFGLLASPPVSVRSWAADCAGLLHPDYVWHETAQGWQTDEVGEAMVSAMVDSDEPTRLALLTDAVGADAAEVLAPGIDADMGRCILGLYRSGRQPALRELGEAVLASPTRLPALVISSPGDPYVASALSVEVGQRLGARIVELPGCGHWWMLEEPGAAADALVEFWSTLT